MTAICTGPSRARAHLGPFASTCSRRQALRRAVPRVHVANPEIDTESGNVAASTSGNVLPVSAARRALEEEAKRLLEQDSQEYTSSATTVNYRLVESKEHLKSLISSTAYGATLVVFGSPSCRSCRALEPKIVGLAEQNEDVLFAKVNTAYAGMSEVAEGLGVPNLPYFLLYSGVSSEGAGGGEKELVSSFTANLSTIDVLRAEISSVKKCLGPGCDL